MHPRWLRCSSVKYSRYSRSSRLARAAPRPSRCDARLSPRAARRSRTAKASRITDCVGKSRRACEWDGWGRLSGDGPGQNNPDRSEDPWGRATMAARMAVLHRVPFPTLSGTTGETTESTNGGCKLHEAPGIPGAGLTGAPGRQAPSERPALEPYWGKPAVRNLRGDDGNVGIIRSPVRTIVLPDRAPRALPGGRLDTQNANVIL